LTCVVGLVIKTRQEEFVMAQIQGPAYTGQTSCDLANVKDVLVDLAPGALMVRETKGQLMNNREHDLNVIAARVIETANRQDKPELLALFEKTITYRSQIAQKGVATRKKNKAPKNELAGPESTAHPV